MDNQTEEMPMLEPDEQAQPRRHYVVEIIALLFIIASVVGLIVVNNYVDEHFNLDYNVSYQSCYLNDSGNYCERNKTDYVDINGTLYRVDELTNNLLNEYCECIAYNKLLEECLEWRCNNQFINR